MQVLFGNIHLTYAILCRKGILTNGIGQSTARNAQSEQDSDLQPVAPVGDPDEQGFTCIGLAVEHIPGIHVEICCEGFWRYRGSGALSFPLFAPRTENQGLQEQERLAWNYIESSSI